MHVRVNQEVEKALKEGKPVIAMVCHTHRM